MLFDRCWDGAGLKSDERCDERSWWRLGSVDVDCFVVFVFDGNGRDGSGWCGMGNWCGILDHLELFDT